MVGIIKHLLVFDNYSNCAAASSSRFLYKLKKKITHPIIYFFKSHPANFLFPIRFHRLRSWTMSQYKNKTLIYNNCTLSCLFFYVHRCIKTHGWKWQAAVTWFSSFFWSMCGMTEQSQRETDTDDVSKKSRKSVVAKFLALKIDFEVAERS